MINLLKSSWALFFGVGMIMLANGLQGSLISIRASLEGYSSFSTGIIMTAYYVGFLIGAKIIPQKIKRTILTHKDEANKNTRKLENNETVEHKYVSLIIFSYFTNPSIFPTF